MCSSARYAGTKYHGLGGLNNRNLILHSSGGCKFKIKVPAGLVSPEASLLALQMAIFPCVVLTRPFLCSCASLVSLLLLIRTLVLLGQGPSLTIITSLKTLLPNMVMLEDKASIYEFGGNPILSIMRGIEGGEATQLRKVALQRQVRLPEPSACGHRRPVGPTLGQCQQQQGMLMAAQITRDEGFSVIHAHVQEPSRQAVR